MWFDPFKALADIKAGQSPASTTSPGATCATRATQAPAGSADVAQVAHVAPPPALASRTDPTACRTCRTSRTPEAPESTPPDDLHTAIDVFEERAAILEVQTDAFWEGITVEQLETVRRALRDLVRLIEPRERNVVYTDFLDEIGEPVPMDLDAVPPGLDKARFKLKVRRFLDRHRDHIAILKLRRAEALTPTDLGELDRIFAEIATPDDAAARAEITAAGGLGPFLRSLAGLDRKAAKAAFDTFLHGRSLTAAQTEFVDLVIDHLTEHGAIDPRRFYESPFTDLDDQGLHGLFPETDIHQILAIVRDIDASARVA